MKPELIELCPTASLSEDEAKEFSVNDDCRIFVVKKEGQFYGYYNRCPHAGWPLNLNPDVFLDLDKEYIQCANHMATFDVTSGKCVAGPCVGANLEKISLTVVNNSIWFQP